MKLFDQAAGNVVGMDADGRGILVAGGKDVHVRFAVPGDTVRVTLVKRRKGELQGRLDDVLSPSPDRVTPRCPHAGACGGCPLQMLGYDAQRRAKRAIVVADFHAAGLDVPLPEVTGSPELFFHRNRMDYVIAPDDRGEPTIGLKEPGRWWKTLPLRTCLMLSEDAVETMRRTREWLRRNAIAPWDAHRQAGFARYLVIREGKNTGERMAILVTAAGDLPDREGLVTTLAPFTTSLFRAVNPRVTDLSIGDTYELLSGTDRLTEEVGGKRFAIGPASFFQTNTAGAGVLAQVVRGFAERTRPRRVLDLYCGVGFLSLHLAESAAAVLGIESDAAAVARAAENAAANGIVNASFRAETAERLSWKEERPDLVVLDPPRAGLHPAVLALLIAAAPPAIVYVSCNHRALARKLPALLARYAVRDARLIDLFPHTQHVETVLLLERK